jgi:hypothetical protein
VSEQAPEWGSDGRTPFVSGRTHTPDYYRTVAPNPRVSEDADVIDVIQAFGLSWELGSALKYLVRAGRKPGSSRDRDLTKALECIQRAQMAGST